MSTILLKRAAKRLICRVLQKAEAKMDAEYIKCVSNAGGFTEAGKVSYINPANPASNQQNRATRKCNAKPVGRLRLKIQKKSDKQCATTGLNVTRKLKEKGKGWI